MDSLNQPVQSSSGPPLPASGLPAGWTMEQWEYYGEQYLASNPQPDPMQAYAQPQTQAYQAPEPVTEAYTPEPVQPVAEQAYQPAPETQTQELDLSSLERTMVQEPAPTPASQDLADLLDDLDL